MIGEVSFDGIFVPTLLVLALVALGAAMLLTRMVAYFGLYRFVAYRALVDLSLFVLLLGLFVWIAPFLGYRI